MRWNIHMKAYEIFDHTSDIGIRIKGKNLKELFKNSGLAIFQISSRRQFVKNKKHTQVIVKANGNDLKDLFINWLNELLSLSQAKGIIFHAIKVIKFEDNSLDASCTASDIVNYKVNTEIKAATYHQLKLEETKDGWLAEVILDV